MNYSWAFDLFIHHYFALSSLWRSMDKTRLELFGITRETKTKVQIIAKAKNISTATLLEPVLRRYVEEPPNKKIIYRHGQRQ